MNPFSHLPRKPLVGLAFSAIGGIVLVDWIPLPLWLLVGLVAVLSGWTLVRPKRALCLAVVATGFATLHTGTVHDSADAMLARQVSGRSLAVNAKGIVWSEPTEFESSRGEPLARFLLRVQEMELQGRNAGAPVLCAVLWVGKAPAYGDLVTIRGEAESLKGPRNPGEFDTAAYLRRKGVAMELRAWSKVDCSVIGHGHGSWVEHGAIRLRSWVKERLERGMQGAGEEVALIESMVLGLQGETPLEMKQLFQKTGTLHLFAVSGLNVAMLAAIVWFLLKPMGVGRRAACFIIAPLLFAYAAATGFGASCVRATVMALFILGAPLAGRPAVLLNSMAGAALTILAWDTNQLFLPGFQLSFVLVLAIILMAGPISAWCIRWFRPDPFIPESLWTKRQRSWVGFWKLMCDASGVTLASWIGSMPFMAGYFHLVSPVAIAANALAVPIAFMVLALGLMALLLSALVPPLVATVNAANWFWAKALLMVVEVFARVPHGHEYVEWPRSGRGAVCEVTALDVGEGAAIHLRAGGGDWLIDSGHARDYVPRVLPYLRSRGIDWLNGFIITHGDSAHVGGSVSVLDDFQPEWIADSPSLDRSPTRRAFHAELAKQRKGRRFFQRGDVVILGRDAVLRVLYPPANLDRAKADDRALVCMVEAGGRRILLASDAGFFTEEWLLKNEPDLRADVLVKGWRTDDFSGTPDFIARVSPQAVVTSHPEFGMTPDQFALWAEPLARRGIALFPQQNCGGVQILISKEGELEVRGTLGK